MSQEALRQHGRPAAGARRRRLQALVARTNPAVWLGALGVTLVIVAAIFAPLIAPHDPLEPDLQNRLMPPAWTAGGSIEHLLGTDQMGRDILSRIIYGARVSLVIGGVAALIAAVIGTLLGTFAGYIGGLADEIIMRLADVRLNIPLILLLITVLSIFGSGIITVVVVLAAVEWVTYARVIRSEAMSLKTRDFILASRSLGSSKWHILKKHLLPNVSSLAIILASAEIGQLILLESTLGFLGLSVPPPTPSWGNMLGDGRDYLADAWWLATMPGIALTLTVLSLITLGDGLRDMFDPRSRNDR